MNFWYIVGILFLSWVRICDNVIECECMISVLSELVVFVGVLLFDNVDYFDEFDELDGFVTVVGIEVVGKLI